MTTEYLGDKRELQAILEAVTDVAFMTGNKTAYDLPSIKAVKKRLLEVIQAEKGHTVAPSGDYGGGGC